MTATDMAVRERPILFSGRLVRAILEGRKTITRRVVKPQPNWGRGGRMVHLGDRSWGLLDGDLSGEWRCPFGQPGDRLWVRENFALTTVGGDVVYTGRVSPWDDVPRGFEPVYAATHDPTAPVPPWRPSIFMPRQASRILLEVTDVRAERLQQMTEADAKAEGVANDGSGSSWPWLGATHPVKGTPKVFPTAIQAFRSLWDSLNAARGYDFDTNAGVWVITFRRVDA